MVEAIFACFGEDISSINDGSKKSTYLENMSTDLPSSSVHHRGFVGGLVTLYYKLKMAADATLDFR